MSTFSTTWHHLRRFPYHTLATTLVMTINIFTLSCFLIASIGFNRVINFFETKPEITIFLKDGLDKPTIDSAQREIAAVSGVKEIRYISKEKALENYREQNKNKPLLLEMVTANILPASFEVTAQDQSVLSQVVQNFSVKKDLVDEIIYPEDVIKPLLQITNTTRVAGIVLIAYLTITTVLLVVGTIGQKITANKDEIKVSRLLGASSWYITSPFIFEGLIYGLLTGVLGWSLALIIFLYFKNQLNIFFYPVSFLDTQISSLGVPLAATLLFSVFWGVISASFAAKRQIKF